jgi:hypothetical protein
MTDDDLEPLAIRRPDDDLEPLPLRRPVEEVEPLALRRSAGEVEPLALRRSLGVASGTEELAWSLGAGDALADEVEFGRGPAVDRLIEGVRSLQGEPAAPPRVVVHEGLNELTPRRFSVQVYRQAWCPVTASVPVIERSARLRRRRAPAIRLDEAPLRVGRSGMLESAGRLRAPWSPVGIRVRLCCYDLAAERTRIELWPIRRRPVLQWRRYLRAGIAVMDDLVGEIEAVATDRPAPQAAPVSGIVTPAI